MPTTIATVSADANIRGLRGNVLATLKNPDLIVVAGFAAIGLLVTIGLTIFLPLSEDRALFFRLSADRSSSFGKGWRPCR